MPCSVAFANAFAGSVRAAARAHSARTLSLRRFRTQPRHARFVGRRCRAARPATPTRGGHRVEQRAQPTRSHHRQASERDRARTVVGLAVHGSSERAVVRDRFDTQLQRDGHVPIGDHLVTAVEVARECGRPGALGGARGLTAGLLRARGGAAPAAARLRGASSSSRDPSIVGVRLDAAGPCDRARGRDPRRDRRRGTRPTGGPMSSSTLGRMIGTRRSNRSTSGPETRRM